MRLEAGPLHGRHDRDILISNDARPHARIGSTSGIPDPRLGLRGTRFAITASGAFQTFHRFSWWDGAHPFAGLTRTSIGAIHGTTAVGGPQGGGVIFRISPATARALAR